MRHHPALALKNQSVRRPGLALHCVTALALAAAAPAKAAGFDFCARPTLPACIEDPQTYRSKAARDACDIQARVLIATAFAYRECLKANVEATIKATNAALDRYRCKKSGARNCGSPLRLPPP